MSVSSADVSATASATEPAAAASSPPPPAASASARIFWDYCLVWRRLVPAKRKSSSSSAAAEAGASSKSGGSAHKAFLQSVQMHASRAVEHHLTQHALTTGVALVSAAVGTSVNSAHHGKSTKTGRLGKLSKRQRAELARMSAKEQRKYERARALSGLSHFQRRHTLDRVKRRVTRSGLCWRQFNSSDGLYTIVQIGATEARLEQAAAVERIALMSCPRALQNVALDRINMLLSNKKEEEASAFWRWACSSKDLFLSLGLHGTGYVLPADLDGDGIDDFEDDDIEEEEGEIAVGLGVDASIPRSAAIHTRFSASDYIYLPMSTGKDGAQVRGRELACVYDLYIPPLVQGSAYNMRAFWGGNCGGCAGAEDDAQSAFYVDLDSDDSSDGEHDAHFEDEDRVFFETRFGEAGGAAVGASVEVVIDGGGGGGGDGGAGGRASSPSFQPLEECVPGGGTALDVTSRNSLKRQNSRAPSSRADAMMLALEEERAIAAEEKRTSYVARRAEAVRKAIEEAKLTVIETKRTLLQAIQEDHARLDHDPLPEDEERLRLLNEKRDAEVATLGGLFALQRRERRRARGMEEHSARDAARWLRARKRRQAIAVMTRFPHKTRVELLCFVLGAPTHVLDSKGKAAVASSILPGCGLQVDVMEQRGAVAAAFPLHDTNYKTRLEAEWVYQSKRWPWTQPLEAQYRAVWRDGCGPNRDFDGLPTVVDLEAAEVAGGESGGSADASIPTPAATAAEEGAAEASGEVDEAAAEAGVVPEGEAAAAAGEAGEDGGEEGDATSMAAEMTPDLLRAQLLRTHASFFVAGDAVEVKLAAASGTTPEQWREAIVVASSCDRAASGEIGPMRYDIELAPGTGVAGSNPTGSVDGNGEIMKGLGAEVLRRQQQQWVWELMAPGIRDYYGESIALYFSFMSFYTLMLVPISIVGVFIYAARITARGFVQLGWFCNYVSGCDEDDFYQLYPSWGAGVFVGVSTPTSAPTSSLIVNVTVVPESAAQKFAQTGPGLGVADLIFLVVLIAWMTLFLEGWKRIQIYLAKRWGTRGLENMEEDRLEFKGETVWKFGVNLEDVRYPFGGGIGNVGGEGGGDKNDRVADEIADPPIISELSLYRTDTENGVNSTRIFPANTRLAKQDYYRPKTRVRVVETIQDPLGLGPERGFNGRKPELRTYLAEIVECHTLGEDGQRSSYDPQEAKRKALAQRKSDAAEASLGGPKGKKKKKKKKKKAGKTEEEKSGGDGEPTKEAPPADDAALPAEEPTKEGSAAVDDAAAPAPDVAPNAAAAPGAAATPAEGAEAPPPPAAAAAAADAPAGGEAAAATAVEGAVAADDPAATPAHPDVPPELPDDHPISADGRTFFTYDVMRIPRGKELVKERVFCAKRGGEEDEDITVAPLFANDETLLVEARNRLDRWGKNAWFLARVHMVLTPYEMEVVKNTRAERAKAALLLERREGQALASKLDISLPRTTGRGCIAERVTEPQFAPSVKQRDNAATHARKEAEKKAKAKAKEEDRAARVRQKAIASGPQKFASSHDDPMVAMQAAKRAERERISKQKAKAAAKRELLLTMRDQIEMVESTVDEEVESDVAGAVGFIQIAEEVWSPSNMNEQEMGEWHRFVVTFANADKKRGSGRVAVQYDQDSDPIEFFLLPLRANLGTGDPLREGATPAAISTAEGIATHATTSDSFRWRIASYDGWKEQRKKDAAALAFDQRVAEEAMRGGAAAVPNYGIRRAQRVGGALPEPEPEPVESTGETVVTIKLPPPKPEPWTLPDPFIPPEARRWGFRNHERLVVEFIECPNAATGMPRMPDKTKSCIQKMVPPATILLLLIFVVVALVGVTLFKFYIALFKGGFALGFLMNAITIIVLSKMYESIASWLIAWENHRTQTEHNNSVIAKFCTFQFANSYNALLYIAFYKKIPMLGRPEGIPCAHDDCIEELELQLAIILIVRLTISNGVELLKPLMKALTGYLRTLQDRVERFRVARAEAKAAKLREALANQRTPVDDLRDGLVKTTFPTILNALRERAARAEGGGGSKKRKKRKKKAAEEIEGGDASAPSSPKAALLPPSPPVADPNATTAATPRPTAIACDDFCDALLVISGVISLPKVERSLGRRFLKEIWDHCNASLEGSSSTSSSKAATEVVEIAALLSSLRYIYRPPFRGSLVKNKAAMQGRKSEIEEEFRGVFDVVADSDSDGSVSFAELVKYFTHLNAVANAPIVGSLPEGDVSAGGGGGDAGAPSSGAGGKKKQKKKKKKKKKTDEDAEEGDASAATPAEGDLAVAPVDPAVELAASCARQVLREYGGVQSLDAAAAPTGPGVDSSAALPTEAEVKEAKAAKLAEAVATPDADVEGWVLTQPQFVECFTTREFKLEMDAARAAHEESGEADEAEADHDALLTVGSSTALLAVDKVQLALLSEQYVQGEIHSDKKLVAALRDLGLPKRDAKKEALRMKVDREALRLAVEDQFLKPEYDAELDTLEDYGEMVINYGCVSMFTNGSAAFASLISFHLAKRHSSLSLSPSSPQQLHHTVRCCISTRAAARVNLRGGRSPARCIQDLATAPSPRPCVDRERGRVGYGNAMAYIPRNGLEPSPHLLHRAAPN